jgi:CRP-like cAMP-binding protein
MGVMRREDFLKNYDPLQIIFAEGDQGDKMYIVHEGSVDIRKENGGEFVHLATFAKGEIFGEMALVEDMARSATAAAGDSGASVMEIDSSLFIYLVSQQPVFALVVLKAMSQRLRNQSEKN